MILLVPQKLPIGKIIGHPCQGEIANFKEKEYSIDSLSSLIHEVNPDYLLFHPSINSIQSVILLASYGAAWVFGQNFFIFIVAIVKYFVIEEFELIVLFPIGMIILFLTLIGFAPLLILRQLKNRKSRYKKVLLLKQTKQLAYYEHKRKQAPIFHLINYKDITASVRRSEG